MDQRTFINFMHTVEKLKCNTRHSWTSSGRHESVAEHSWRLSVMAMLCAGEYPHIDMNKVVKMCLVHDWGEALTGDIPSFDKTSADENEESRAICRLLSQLSEPERGELAALFAEMDAQETEEAKLYKALDNMEAVLSHNEAPISTWIEKEYELNLTYGEDKASFSQWTKVLREQLRRDTVEKIAER